MPKTQDHRDQGLEESSITKTPRIQRYLVAIEYIGTRFSGSQQQPNCRTVVGVLEDAGVGVHALSNVCHVDVERISKRKPGEVNEGDISMIDVRCDPNDFHARFKAHERTYFYRLVSGPGPLTTLEKERAWHVQENLDLHAMQEACKVLVGHHDFSSFRASGCQANSPIRTLDELHVCEVPATPYFPSITEREQNSNDGKSNLEEFGVRRRHRCYVVRLLVGVLKCAGTGELTTSDVAKILNANTVTAASPMTPACGLYLGRVKYDLP
ncbi:hypothetical protein V6N12_056089 [Hibiscus sabdariffa]|uniref:tRNA pseudouridine synthase n=1 Tax=Hibiscus sabdariffa TaxID=183260 RepID=A0ABR2CRI9_9ROSI